MGWRGCWPGPAVVCSSCDPHFIRTDHRSLGVVVDTATVVGFALFRLPLLLATRSCVQLQSLCTFIFPEHVSVPCAFQGGLMWKALLLCCVMAAAYGPLAT